MVMAVVPCLGTNASSGIPFFVFSQPYRTRANFESGITVLNVPGLSQADCYGVPRTYSSPKEGRPTARPPRRICPIRRVSKDNHISIYVPSKSSAYNIRVDHVHNFKSLVEMWLTMTYSLCSILYQTIHQCINLI